MDTCSLLQHVIECNGELPENILHNFFNKLPAQTVDSHILWPTRSLDDKSSQNEFPRLLTSVSILRDQNQPKTTN